MNFYPSNSLQGYQWRKWEKTARYKINYWFFVLLTIPLILLGKKKPEISLLLATGFITLNSTFA